MDRKRYQYHSLSGAYQWLRFFSRVRIERGRDRNNYWTRNGGSLPMLPSLQRQKDCKNQNASFQMGLAFNKVAYEGVLARYCTILSCIRQLDHIVKTHS